MLSFFNNIKLKNKLMLSFSFIVLFPVIVLGIFFTAKQITAIKDNLYSMGQTTVEQVEVNIKDVLKVYSDIITVIIKSESMQTFMQTEYETAYSAYKYFNEKISENINKLRAKDINAKIRIYTNNSTIDFVPEFRHSMDSLISSAESNYAQFSSNEINYGIFYNEEEQRKQNVCFIVLQDEQKPDKYKAVICVLFDEEKLYSLFSEEKKSGKKFFIFNKNNSVIATTEPDMQWSSFDGVTLDSGEQLKEIANKSIVDFNDKKYFIINSQINDNALNIKAWGMIYMIPADNLLDYRRNLYITSITLCIVCLFISFILILLVSKNVTGRIEKIINNMKKVRKGDFILEPTESKTDEIGLLETNFNTMVNKIDTLIRDVYMANLKAKNAEIEKIRSQFIAMKHQINPHYLYNTLESIRMSLILKSDRETARIIMLFSESFKEYIYCDDEIFTLREEIKFIKSFVEVEKFKLGEKLDFSIHVPRQLLENNIPKLLIQPLIENAIYHGMEGNRKGIKIIVDIKKGINDMFIFVIDNGSGIKQDKLTAIKNDLTIMDNVEYAEKTNGIALLNVHRRLKLKYGEEYGLRIKSKEGIGTVIRICVPLRGLED